MATSRNKRNSRNSRRRKKKNRKILIVVLEILFLAVLLGVLALWNMISKINFEGSLNPTEAGINDDLNESTLFAMEQYTNIALFGLDNRGSNNYESGNTDTIMIASINNDTKEVQLVSVYRDTYLSIGNGKYRKANAAYANGGAKQAVQMLNSNLDLDITAYVCVDWSALVEAIDALGGIDIEITGKEVPELNKCIPEIDQMTGMSTPNVTESGMVHLNGTQATAYARIRSTAGDDFMRASRQRIVLQAMLDKAKDADIATLTSICNEVFDNIYTSLSLKDLLYLAKDVKSYSIKSTTGFPFELTTMNLSATGDTVIPAELDNNVAELHEYLFEETDYVPSNSVQTISDAIVDKTGVTKDSALIDTSKYNETAGESGTDFQN